MAANTFSGNGSLPFWREPLDAQQIPHLSTSITIFPDLCKGCGYCVEFCPAQVLATSDRLNAKGYHPPEVVKPEACTGCQFCMRVCPEYAIIVEKKLEVPT